MKRTGKILLWIFFFPFMLISTIIKSDKLKKPMKAGAIVAIVAVLYVIGTLFGETEPVTKEPETVEQVAEATKATEIETEPVTEAPTEIETEPVATTEVDTETKKETVAEATPAPTTEAVVEVTWKDKMPNQDLVSDIEKAFTEIGEDPDNIISVEYVQTKTSDLYYRRDYKVVFEKGKAKDLLTGERKWIHAYEWRITTEEWFEGEPERELYPREYLVTIRFWRDDDATSILQWSHTGNGKLQEQ